MKHITFSTTKDWNEYLQYGNVLPDEDVILTFVKEVSDRVSDRLHTKDIKTVQRYTRMCINKHLIENRLWFKESPLPMMLREQAI